MECIDAALNQLPLSKESEEEKRIETDSNKEEKKKEKRKKRRDSNSSSSNKNSGPFYPPFHHRYVKVDRDTWATHSQQLLSNSSSGNQSNDQLRFVILPE